jgi:hypothetical protein
MMKIRLLNITLAFLSAAVFISCTNTIYLTKINSYLNSSSAAAKSRYMSDSFHSFFMNKEEKGDDKARALNDFINWDGQLNPDVKILSHSRKGHTWLVNFNEQNDFSKLIGFPGWRGSMSVAFNDKRLIAETIYLPDSTNPSYKQWLQPAIDWLQINMPAELAEVYQNNRLVKDSIAANKWKRLLKMWNDNKNSTRRN